MNGESVLSLIKVTAAAGAAGAASSPFIKLFTQYVSLPVWGVPVSVFGAAACGAGMSLFFGDPVTSRRDLYGQVTASTFFGVGTAVLVADGMGWEWAQTNISMFALMSAAILRWFLPTIIERGKRWFHDMHIPWSRKSQGDKK